MARPRNFDVDDVLGAALLTFWERGYAATSVGDLVEATGLSRSSLYGAWGDKEGLFVAVLERYDQLVVAFVLGPLEAADADLDSIERVLSNLVAGAEHAPTAFGCLFAHSGSERGHRDERIGARVLAHQRRMEAAFANALGSVRCSGPVHEVAAMLTVFARGLATQIRAGADRGHLDASVRALMRFVRSTQELS